MIDCQVGDVITTKRVSTAELEVRVGSVVTVATAVEIENLDTPIIVSSGQTIDQETVNFEIEFRHIWKLYRSNVLIYEAEHAEIWPIVRWYG